MEVKTIFVKYDIRRMSPPNLITYTHENDVNTQSIELLLTDGALPLALSPDYTYTAAIVNKDTKALIKDNVACTLNANGNVLIPIDDLGVHGSQNLKVELTVTDLQGDQTLSLPFALWIKSTGSILNGAEVIPEVSKGVIPKLIQDAEEQLQRVKTLKDGKSAYEIALDNGFVGTESEWLVSLKGAKGDTGADWIPTEAELEDITEQAAEVLRNEIVDPKLSVLLENQEATYIPKDGTHAGAVLPMNGRISLSGAYEASASFSSSDFIPVTPLLTIVPHCYGHQSALSVAFYNANKEFISGVGVQANWEPVPQDIDIPAGAAYYRLCEMVAHSSGYIDVSYVTRESTKELAAHKAAEDAEFAQVNSRIEDVEQALTASSHVAVTDVTGQSGFVDANGVFNSSASWVVTDYMPTKTLLSLTEHVRVYSGRPNVVFYDKYKVFISANVPDTSTVIDAAIVPPDNAYYFRLNFIVEDTVQYYDLTIDKLAASAIETANKCDPLFGKKIGAVGDSITIGTYSVPGNTYVNQIANAHGMTVNNAAVWGSIFPTGKTENDAPRGSIFSQIATLDNDCDIIIISGGINDAEYYSDDTYWGQVSGGYEAELDPATFCGAFEGTLKTALNKFPGKPIIFVFEHRITQPYQSIYGQHFENVQLPLMLEMLKKWGIPYVDLFHETPSIARTPGYIALYSVDNKGVHPNIAGYRKFYTPHVESAIQAIAK